MINVVITYQNSLQFRIPTWPDTKQGRNFSSLHFFLQQSFIGFSFILAHEKHLMYPPPKKDCIDHRSYLSTLKNQFCWQRWLYHIAHWPLHPRPVLASFLSSSSVLVPSAQGGQWSSCDHVRNHDLFPSSGISNAWELSKIRNWASRPGWCQAHSSFNPPRSQRIRWIRLMPNCELVFQASGPMLTARNKTTALIIRWATNLTNIKLVACWPSAKGTN